MPVKILVLVLSAVIFYREIFIKDRFAEILDSFQSETITQHLWLLAFAILLVFFNWGIEARKWQLLIRKIQPLSFFTAVEAVFSGVFVSFFTPNRVGEFAGRILYIKSSKRIASSIVTIIGSFSQLVCTIVFGSLAFGCYYAMQENISFLALFAFFLSFVIVLLLLLLFFNIDLFNALLRKIPRLQMLGKYTKVLSWYHFGELWPVLLLSAARYGIFTLQYLILIRVFGIDISWINGCLAIAMIFLAQTIVPSFALTELGVRGAASIYFFSLFAQKPLEVALAAYTLWFLNIFLPALAGGILLLFLPDKTAETS